MAHLLGGYYMSFPSTRVLLQHYNIDDKGADDDLLESPINDWLARNNKLEILAGAICHPDRGTAKDKEDGILIVTHPVFSPKKEPQTVTFPEDKQDIAAKEWLMAGGVAEEDLEWICFWDTVGLTRMGLQPRRNERGRTRPVMIKLTDEEWSKWVKIVMKGGNLKAFLGEEEYERRRNLGQ
ncbi:hypothetical protein BDP27DRAFT_1336319 [Rhodocollybia butyracea]|uniref:Uncharacterized protein n=1 Tax=Rhodocollybia butyracea TaxID=206335 RepID=A0A9P5PFW4_9AGAR|nr:hypothetical protein BDP27DRAFT_1336319 [Rhodocollybia butyracea]